jgi:hypothetical protein
LGLHNLFIYQDQQQDILEVVEVEEQVVFQVEQEDWVEVEQEVPLTMQEQQVHQLQEEAEEVDLEHHHLYLQDQVQLVEEV